MKVREKLYLTYANSRRLWGQYARNLPSQFLMEIPSELYEIQNRSVDESSAETDEEEIEIDYDLSDES